MFEKIALIAAVTLPVWNIPLIVRVVKRKSADDISMLWLLGVWFSFLAMAPDGLTSEDLVWRAFNAANLVMFTVVVGVVLYYKKYGKHHDL